MLIVNELQQTNQWTSQQIRPITILTYLLTYLRRTYTGQRLGQGPGRDGKFRPTFKSGTEKRLGLYSVPLLITWCQGRSDGGYIGIYTPKVSPSKLFMGVKMTSERLFNSFIPPKTFIPPKQISGYAPAWCPQNAPNCTDLHIYLLNISGGNTLEPSKLGRG